MLYRPAGINGVAACYISFPAATKNVARDGFLRGLFRFRCRGNHEQLTTSLRSPHKIFLRILIAVYVI